MSPQLTREIPLTRGYVALVDDDDYDLVSKYKWYVLILPNRAYAMRSVTKNGRRTSQYMHQLITGYKQTDHIDQNGLNNQKINLRPATHVQNQGNVKSWTNNTSGYRGVKRTASGKWGAYLNTKEKCRYLGSFTMKEEAAKVYDKAALEYFGEFARLNFPEEKAPSTE